jgi:hypothetical protein
VPDVCLLSAVGAEAFASRHRRSTGSICVPDGTRQASILEQPHIRKQSRAIAQANEITHKRPRTPHAMHWRVRLHCEKRRILRTCCGIPCFTVTPTSTVARGAVSSVVAPAPPPAQVVAYTQTPRWSSSTPLHTTPQITNERSQKHQIDHITLHYVAAVATCPFRFISCATQDL